MCSTVQGQTFAKRNTFNTDHGLASNHIYDIVEDNKGFLWVSTDNGISRFDGKYFQNFSVRQGLPSNEVLQVLKDKNGTIWINCFKQNPAYFDDLTNRFIAVKNNAELNEISKSLLRLTLTTNGNVRFSGRNKALIYQNNKTIVPIANLSEDLAIENKKLSLKSSLNINQKKTIRHKFLLYHNKQNIDSLILNSATSIDKQIMLDNQLYLFSNKNLGYKIAFWGIKPLSYQIDSIHFRTDHTLQKFSNGKLTIISQDGMVSIFNKDNLRQLYQVNVDRATNCAYIDRFDNLWIGTLDKGLVFYSKNKIKTIQTNENFINNNFLSIAVNNTGELAAGNYDGEILQLKNKLITKKTVKNPNRTTWIRKIIYTQNNIIALHDIGYTINFGPTRNVLAGNGSFAYAKSAALMNDTLMVIGSNSGLIKLNTKSFETKMVRNSTPEITLSLVKANQFIYYIGQKGLYKYSLVSDSAKLISLGKTWSSEKLKNLAYAQNNMLWASTASGKLLLLHEDKIVSCINENTGIPENISCIATQNNSIWLGSKSGISIIDYKFKNGKLTYMICNVSKNDGLPSNTVNDFSMYIDTMYAATENGIAKIPLNYKNSAFDIKPEITGIKINNKVVEVAKTYQLNSDENNIAMQFAGVELSGHFKNIQYAINDQSHWNDLDGNTLNIQLNNGSNDIYIRARDVNNRVSKNSIQINFFIKTPFYKAIWFWAFITICISSLIFWVFSRRKLAKQQIKFNQQLALEQQRSTITADLHDDIGATLSSLQLNSAVANRLIHKDIKQTQKILDKIENQSKSLSDKIGDIIWNMKPGKDEFMTIGSRIKNFANDILGATNIHYHIQIDPTLNTKLTDINTRKNIVFITKEAINNIAKYSQSSHAVVNIEIINNRIYLKISDNGIGFDPFSTLGNGLSNMKKRTTELNGTFHLESSKENGSIISVMIPLVP